MGETRRSDEATGHSGKPTGLAEHFGSGPAQWEPEVRRWGPWVLLGLVALVFSRALRFGFVYDDRWTLLDNPVIRDPGNAWSLLGRGFARAGVPDAGRPLMLLTEMFDWAVWKSRPFGFHLQNMVWHAAAALLVQRVLLRWGFAARTSLAAAALFAVHPLVVEPVVVINYREDLIALVLMLAALALLAPRPSLRNVHRVAAGVVVGAAALAKESAFVAPLLWAALVAVTPVARAGERSWRQQGRDLLALVLPIGAVFVWRWWAYGAPAIVSLTAEIPEAHRRWGHALPRGFATHAQGFAQFLWPARLAPEYPDLSQSVSAWGWGLGFALVVVTALAWRVRTRLPGVTLGWLIAVAGYAPHFGFVALTNLRADRYFYVSIIGWSLLTVALVAWVLAALGRQAARVQRHEAMATSVALVFLVAAIAGLGLRARAHARVYRDDVAVFTAAAASDPRSQRAQVGLALASLRAGQRLAAGEAAARAVALSPSPRALEAAGLVALAQGDFATAKAQLGQALAGSEGQHRAQVLFNLGMAERRTRDWARAEAHWREAIAVAPGFDLPAIAMAQAAIEQGESGRARQMLEELLVRVPQSIAGWRTLARLEEQERRREAAELAWERVRRLGGRDGDASPP
jgi:Tfp pilus assembly protein PilF